MIIKLLSLYLVCAVTLSNTRNITYIEPGMYLLSASEYNFSDYIFIEMWGGGGGGSSYTIGIGGGAFISAIVRTNKETFRLSVGKGGVRGDKYSYDGCYRSTSEIKIFGEPGGDTKFTNGNYINLVAGGGGNGVNNHGIVKSLRTNTDKYSYRNGSEDSNGGNGSIIVYYDIGVTGDDIQYYITPTTSLSTSITKSNINSDDIVLFIFVLLIVVLIFLFPFVICYIKQKRYASAHLILKDSNTSLLTREYQNV